MRVIEIKTVDGSRFEFPEDRYAINPYLFLSAGNPDEVRSVSPKVALEDEKDYIIIGSLDFKKKFYFTKLNIAYIVEKRSEEG